MARTFDGPLSAKDITFLRARYSAPYVQRQIELLGTEDGAEEASDASAEEDRQQAEADTAEAAQKAEEARLAAEAADAEAAAEAEAERQRQEAEDLIGGTGDFDVLGSTEAEVKTWAESASDEDKAAALQVEQSREDRDPRKGVVAILG
jgi:hypothetical protein